MVDRMATMATLLASKLASLDWSICDNMFTLEGLHGVVGLISNAEKQNILSALASVQACVPHLPPQPQALNTRFSLDLDVILTYNKRGPRRVSVIALARFYKTFCDTSVTTKAMNDFLHENISLVISRRFYSKPKKYVSQVVAALTFTRPREDQATYLAYIAVSDGRGQLPSFTDAKVVLQPTEGILMETKAKGYQGLGLSRLLLALLDRIMCTPPFQKVTLVSFCFLHYNNNNTGSEELWKALGFSKLSLKRVKSNTNLPAFQTLVRGRIKCPIFNASHADSENCTIVYRKASKPAKDDDAKDDDAKSSSDEKETEWFDDYEPGIAKRYRASQPTIEYSLDADELEAKYEKVKRKNPAPLAFILEMALERKRLREDRGFENQFADQQYIDFACLQDPNRVIEVDAASLHKVDRESLLKVMIDSYHLPASLYIEDAYDKGTRLKPKATVIKCNWLWLEKELLPEVAANLEESIFGIRVIEGIGLDHMDSSVANRDAASMASFLGVHTRIQDFVSPPATHLKITLPVNEFGGRKAVDDFFTQKLDDHAEQTRLFQKHVESLGILKEPPPLPRERYQISRLKWIPTDDRDATDAIKLQRGYFQGAYIVPGTQEFSIVSLKDEWIDREFDPGLLREIKAQGVDGLRARERFIVIPPGSSKQQPLPPASLLHFLRQSRFQQGENSTCLLDCFSSALFDFGCTTQVNELRNHPDIASLTQTNITVWHDFGNLVNRHFKPVDLQLFRQSSIRQVDELLACDDSFVIVATLSASDGMIGQHAIAIFNDGIYDANCPHVLKKTREALDWCCGDGPVTCIGVHRSYQVLPKNHKDISPEMKYIIQTRDAKDCNVRGWIAASSGKKVIVQFADGNRHKVSMEELGNYTRLT